MSIVVDIERKLGRFRLNVAFEAGNETVALLGGSGCGKSMTLRCIAGIDRPDRGRIILDGVTLFDSEKRIDLPPQARHVGMMFQNYALFPNMTVAQNIHAGAKREKDKAKREAAVRQVLENFGLTELVAHYPRQLSGGQQQRVALARMLVSDPKILLLDEPFSALDSHLRFRLEREVRAAVRAFGKSVLLVSHDRDEVYRMADSIAVMNQGHIESFGDRHSVFAAPQTQMGAALTGCKNISAVEKRSDGRVYAVDWGMELSVDGDLEGVDYVGIRMRHIREGQGENSVRCRVTEVIENPFSYTIMMCPAGSENTTPIGWEVEKRIWESMGKDELDICIPPERMLLLKK